MTAFPKLSLSLEFLRGILFSYVAYQLYSVLEIAFFGLSFPESLHLIGVASTVFAILILSAICYALLFTPQGYVRFVTVFLGVIVIFQLFSVLFSLQFRPPGLPSPFNRAVLSQLAIGSLMVAISWTYGHFLKNRKC